MWLQFFLENIHFAFNLFEALVVFAIFWLYFDAWLVRKRPRDLPKILGFLLFSISFVFHAVYIETSVVSTSFFDPELNGIIVNLLRTVGFGLIIFGLIIEPLEDKPQSKLSSSLIAIGFLGQPLFSTVPLSILQPVLSVIVGILYLRRATLGLENHIKRVAIAFFGLALGQLLFLGNLLTSSRDIDVYKIVAPFGPVWLAEHSIVFVCILVLQIWVFGYLFKRLQSQLFMIITTVVLVIFLTTTVAFTGLLLRNLEDETLKQLESDVKVLNYAIESKKAESLSDSVVISQNPQVIGALLESNRDELYKQLVDFLLAKKMSSLVVTNESGKVIARAEDRDRVGDSLSSDLLVKRSMTGTKAASAVLREGPLAPVISIKGAAPIFNEGEIIGTVVSGVDVDNAFVDGIKEATGLAASIYGENTLSATTLLSQDQKSRPIGIKEENSKVKSEVLAGGKSQKVSINILNVPYFAAFLPLSDIDNNTVGMLFVGKPQIGVLQTASRSIEMTFIVTAILLVVSIIPSYWISRYIANQIR